MILSNAAYLTARFPDVAPATASPDAKAALHTLNSAAHAALRAVKGTPLHGDLMQLALATGALVARVADAPREIETLIILEDL